jgi:chromosomal replication initiator protein
MPLGQPSDLRDIVMMMLRTVEQHGELLDKLAEYFTENRPTLEEIKQAVAEFYDVPIVALNAHTRYIRHVHPRLIVYYLARRLTRLSLNSIALRMGERDHTTVHSGYHKLANRVHRDEILRDDLDVLKSRIAEKVMQRQASRGRA